MAQTPRTSGVFSLGALGGDGAATSDDLNWSDVVLLLDGSSTTDLSSASPTVTFTSSGISAGNSGGKYGQYIDLQDSGYITVGLGQNIGANGDPFTVETWARFDSQSDEGIFNLTTTGSFNNASNSISIGTNGTSWNIYHDGGASQQVSPGPSNATWYHVAVVFDGTNLVYYVGGSAILTKSNHSANIPAAGYSTVMIGGYFSTSYVMNGRIEDFRVTDGVARYNGPFTPPQEALPQATAATTRPTRRWGGMTGRSLVGSGAAVAGDANWNDVVLLLDGISTTADVTGSTTITSSGVTAKPASGTGGAGLSGDAYGDPNGYVLDGSGTQITSTGGGSTYSFTNDFTLEAWVYLDTISTNNTLFRMGGSSFIGHMASFSPSSTATGTWILYLPNAADSGFGSTQNATLFTGLTTGAWKHIAVTKSGNTYRGYVNGVQTSGNIVDTTAGALSSDVLRVGLGGSYGWYGKMQDVRFTQGVARDIAADWTAGVYSSPLPQGPAVAASTNVPATGVLSLAEHYQGKL